MGFAWIKKKSKNLKQKYLYLYEKSINNISFNKLFLTHFFYLLKIIKL